ncbi:MAG: NADPH-dependent glutamate synthase [bacterium]
MTRQEMPRQPASVRVENFSEVALGYTKEQSVMEAQRCLQCKKPFCSIKGCPIEIDIPGFIGKIAQEDFLGAVKIIKEKNSLPAICGRVCPQETQCEQFCVLGKKSEPVAIGRLERFVADYEAQQGTIDIPPPAMRMNKKVAVVGSGPAGLTAASDLSKLGYDVTLFEAFHKTGGVLVYGIPEFRLPKSIVEREVEYIQKLGVEVRKNFIVGKTLTVDELLEDGYEAVFLANGAGLPKFMNIPGENLIGVYSANEFLTRVNLMKAYLFPQYDTPIIVGKKVAVFGGGNVAMDSARTAKRLGADEVYIIYRRSRKEMPARIEEVENAEEEGIIFKLLTNPIKIIGNDSGMVSGLECIVMELGEPDESGRRRPIPIKGSEFSIDIDTVVVAIGNGANPLVASTTKNLAVSSRGYIIADEKAGQTSRKEIFAGGDIVTGAATVISAMGAGRRAARGIDNYLKSLPTQKPGSF